MTKESKIYAKSNVKCHSTSVQLFIMLSLRLIICVLTTGTTIIIKWLMFTVTLRIWVFFLLVFSAILRNS